MPKVAEARLVNTYLESTEIIDWRTPAVLTCAQEVASAAREPVEVARACFEWVRDEIAHSGDAKAEVTTCAASEVLEHRTGWCFAKSHLLAALLRANGLPAGLCYQRLERDDGCGFTLHGLNAVLLPEFGWYRIDARGNKPGVDARFHPPVERLAWPVSAHGEVDLPGIWPDPAPIVVRCLREHRGWLAVCEHLPDIAIAGDGSGSEAGESI